jgi:DedD protein
MRDLREIKSRYEFQLDNRQLVLIFAGMVLILILVFILGILFGRSYSSPEAVTLAATSQTASQPADVIMESDISEKDKPEEAEFEEEKEREELIQKLEAEKVPTSLPPATESEGSEEPDQTRMPEPEPAEEPALEKPASVAAGEKEPSPALPASTSGPYTIQMASFQNKTEAQALVSKLKESKYDAYIVEVDLGAKGIWYRVRVGHYPDRDLADKALKIIQTREKAFKDAYITH